MTSAIRHSAGDLAARVASALEMHIVLSTAHLTQDVSEVLDLICDTAENRDRPSDPTGGFSDEIVVCPYRYGHWVRPFLTADLSKLPDCLAACLAHAQALGASWILFDRDQPAIDELPSYEW